MNPSALSIIYRHLNIDKNVWAYYGGVHIAIISWSDALQKWLVRFVNISDELHECNDKIECDELVRKKWMEFILEPLRELFADLDKYVQSEMEKITERHIPALL